LESKKKEMTITNKVRSQMQNHPYHLVDPSPWPLMSSFSLLSLAMTAALTMHGYIGSSYALIFNLLLVTASMFLWFRDIIAEGSFIGDHTIAVKAGLNNGFVLFVTSEALFFLSIFWAYFHSSIGPNVEIGSVWPPYGFPIISPYDLPLTNTILLLSSGASLTYSHHSLIHGNRKNTIIGLIITLILSIVFTFVQGVEYNTAPFSISDGVYGTVFFFSTGFHGLHVIIGTIMLAISLYRIMNYQLTDQHHVGYETAILYWHFVDVVWLFLFISVYWWGSLSVNPIL
jgi:cytochrome c oxidase subunit 3